MYSIEKLHYGIKLTFKDFIKKDEMSHWVNESEGVLNGIPSGFGVFVDMRELKPLPQDSRLEMEKGQKLYKQSGMARSVVILNSALMTMQFKSIAKETGIYEWERYIDASKNSNWVAEGEKWLTDAVDPDT